VTAEGWKIGAGGVKVLEHQAGDSVANLVFQHLDAARTDLPAFRCHPSFNGVLVPGVHANVGIRRGC